MVKLHDPLQTFIMGLTIRGGDIIYIIATCEPGREGDAILELEWALGRVKVRGTQWRGVLVAETRLSIEEALERIRRFETQAIQRVVPLDTITSVDTLEEEVLKLVALKLPPSKFAVRVRVRGSHMSSKEMERKLGSEILARFPGLRVDLTNPDWVVVVEVLGEKAGVGVVRSGDLLRLETKG